MYHFAQKLIRPQGCCTCCYVVYIPQTEPAASRWRVLCQWNFLRHLAGSQFLWWSRRHPQFSEPSWRIKFRSLGSLLEADRATGRAASSKKEIDVWSVFDAPVITTTFVFSHNFFQILSVLSETYAQNTFPCHSTHGRYTFNFECTIRVSLCYIMMKPVLDNIYVASKGMLHILV